MKTRKSFKTKGLSHFRLLPLTLYLLPLTLFSQDTIQFTWSATAAYEPLTIGITATAGKQFTLDWGNGYGGSPITATGDWMDISTQYADTGEYTVIIASKDKDCFITGLRSGINSSLDYRTALNTLDVSRCPSLEFLDCASGNLKTLDVSGCPSLEFLDCGNNLLTELNLKQNVNMEILGSGFNQLTDLDLHKNSALLVLECSNNQLTSLTINKNTKLEDIYCGNNRLQLSNLYYLSKSSIYAFALGTQRLDSSEVMVEVPVDFSAQSIFDGVKTNFKTDKNGVFTVNPKDYTQINGILTFKDTANYTVTMTNTAIISSPKFPAKVIAEFKVVPNPENAIIDNQLPITKYGLQITENQLLITSYELQNLDIAVFDITGRQVSQFAVPDSQFTINISRWQAGIYFVRINGIVNKIVKY